MDNSDVVGKPPQVVNEKDSNTANMETAQNKISEEEEMEDVFVVPKRLTKSGYEVLVETGVCPKPYHFQGRYGSRTHRISDTHMGLPIISEKLLLEKANSTNPELNDLLKQDGVYIARNPFTPAPSFRARDPPDVDARIHPERQPIPDPVDYSKPTTSTPMPGGESNGTKSSASKPLFTYAELFAGVGGFGVALDALGGKCIFVSELDANCRQLFKHNLLSEEKNTDKMMFGDIYKVRDSDFPKAGKLDILVAGFPCQPFSTLGEQPGLEDKEKGLLFQEIVRCLNISRPKGFLLENVPGLLGMKDTYELMLQKFQECGYNVKTEVLSARGLTVTGRKRLFFVGHRQDLVSAATEYEFPFVPDLKLRAQDVLDYDDLPEDELAILRLADTTMTQLLESKRWRPASLAWPNKVLETLISHYGNAVGRGESQLCPCNAPCNPRRFSPRECARIMGFPNTYQLLPQSAYTGPEGHNYGDMAYRKMHYRMFGNAVCPPLIAILAGSVLSKCQFEKYQHQPEEIDWTTKGRHIAVQLAYRATRNKPVKLPRGCLVPKDTTSTAESYIESKRAKRKRKQQRQQQEQENSSKNNNVSPAAPSKRIEAVQNTD